MQDFIKFIREQGVIGLAIAFILGGAVAKVVSSLVKDIIQPNTWFISRFNFWFSFNALSFICLW